MRGKYSPTVNHAYSVDQDWFRHYTVDGIYDPEGYDAYGYNSEDRDRAGNAEWDYYSNDAPFDSDRDYNDLYDEALRTWGFDGVKPLLR